MVLAWFKMRNLMDMLLKSKKLSLSNFKAQCYVGNTICQKKLCHIYCPMKFFFPFNIYLEAVQWASCCGFAVFCKTTTLQSF